MVRISYEMARWLVNVLDAFPAPAPGTSNAAMMSDLRQTINTQLNTPNHYDDLIDTVVKVVSDHRINSLGRDYLTVLRKALLSPLEMSKFRSMVDKGQGCSNCGTSLGEYEAVVVRNLNIYCHRCAHPEMVTCPQCRQAIDMSGLHKSIMRQVERHKCAWVPATDPVPQTDDGQTLTFASLMRQHDTSGVWISAGATAPPEVTITRRTARYAPVSLDPETPLDTDGNS